MLPYEIKLINYFLTINASYGNDLRLFFIYIRQYYIFLCALVCGGDLLLTQYVIINNAVMQNLRYIFCKKQFFVVDTESDKVKDLLGKLGLSERKALDFLSIAPIDYAQVEVKLEPLILKSKKFLLDNLK